MRARMNIAFVFGLLACTLGCGADRPRVPDGPSASITRASSIPTMTMTVSCVGPANELATLGSLCTSATAFHRIGTPTSLAMRVAGSPRDPYLVVVGYPAPGTPDDGPFDPSTIGYAAFLVIGGPTNGVVPEIQAWTTGMSLTGSLLSSTYSFATCTTSWVGGGTLTAGGVTITLSWSSAIPC